MKLILIIIILRFQKGNQEIFAISFMLENTPSLGLKFYTKFYSWNFLERIVIRLIIALRFRNCVVYYINICSIQ
jgi:hypothetical protein